MSVHDKIFYKDKIFTIIYDYDNGMYEIRNDSRRFEVFLVSEAEIYKL